MGQGPSDRTDGPSRWQTSENRKRATEAYHIWKPRPLLRSVHWRPSPDVPPESETGAYEIFLDQRAFASMHEHVWSAPVGEEAFGYLVGDLCEDPETERRYVIVSAAVPSPFPYRENAEPQITPESDVALKLEVDRRRGVLVGWYHRHLRGPPVLSETDLVTFETLFREPWQIALLFVTTPSEPTGACFARTEAGLSGERGVPFYEVVTNESLRARGVRRSRWDWSNVTTVDHVEPDPLPRPDSLPQTAETEGAPEPVPVRPRPESGGDAAAPFVETGEEHAAGDELDLGAEPGSAGDSDGDEEAAKRAAADVSDGRDETGLDFDTLIAEVAEADVESQTQETTSEAVPSRTAISREPEAGEPRLEEGEPARREAPEKRVEGERRRTQEDEQERGIPAETVPARSRESGESLASPEEPPVARAELPEVTIASRRGGRLRESRRALWTVGLLVVVGAAIAGTAMLISGHGDLFDRLPSLTDEPAVLPSETGTEGMPSAAEAAEEGETDAGRTASPERVSIERFETLAEDLLGSISRFYGLAVALDQGSIECQELQAAYVDVEDRWIAYSVDGRARWAGRLPDGLAERDERLYQGVRDAEQEFARSGCERP